MSTVARGRKLALGFGLLVFGRTLLSLPDTVVDVVAARSSKVGGGVHDLDHDSIHPEHAVKRRNVCGAGISQRERDGRASTRPVGWRGGGERLLKALRNKNGP